MKCLFKSKFELLLFTIPGKSCALTLIPCVENTKRVA